jgi:hypothetical protein
MRPFCSPHSLTARLVLSPLPKAHAEVRHALRGGRWGWTSRCILCPVGPAGTTRNPPSSAFPTGSASDTHTRLGHTGFAAARHRQETPCSGGRCPAHGGSRQTPQFYNTEPASRKALVDAEPSGRSLRSRPVVAPAARVSPLSSRHVYILIDIWETCIFQGIPPWGFPVPGIDWTVATCLAGLIGLLAAAHQALAASPGAFTCPPEPFTRPAELFTRHCKLSTWTLRAFTHYPEVFTRP